MNLVETILLENIDNPGSLFIFPTDVAASRWADHVLCITRKTIAMNKFIAWDTFKQNSIRSKVQNKQSIPAVLRKMFAASLIQENAQLCARAESGTKKKQPVFSSLIRSEWAQQADSFAGWITGILPQLGIWYRQTTGSSVTGIDENAVSRPAEELDVHDKDLYNLALRYSRFLKEHGLFEPAWETPPFENNGNDCFLFFSKSLTDFSEYRDLLEASSHVKIINADSDEDCFSGNFPCEVFYYDNSRSEITEAALYIIALHNNRNIPWDSISVSIPDSESYGPYLLRESENRNIPYINRTGKPLASYPAGQFFKALADCASGNFSFASLTALLLNRHLPWKDNYVINDLIGFGIKNNCICSWAENDDGKETAMNVWEDAFTNPFGSYKTQTRRFFEDIKRRINALRYAGSFAEIRKQYFAFRTSFFNMENVLNETDIVLSRCVSELTYLTEIEKSFPTIRVPDPYLFFTGYLEEISYLAQQAASGVTILPYRTAAPAPFDCHIILGANQENLSIIFSPLVFLPRSRREKLGMADNDASQAFINLHRFNSRLPAAFFCSEHTFSGYAIPYSKFNVDAGLKINAAGKSFASDPYRQEILFFKSIYQSTQDNPAAEPETIHLIQKQGFDSWRMRRNHPAVSEKPLPADHPLLTLIRDQYCKNEQLSNRISISPSSLDPYFQCPFKWIFARVLQLENVKIETGLMAYNTAGIVYHTVLNLFLDEIGKTDVLIAPPDMGGTDDKPLPVLPEPYRRLLAEKIEIVFDSFPRLPNSKKTEMSMLTARLLLAEKKLFYAKLEKLLAVFISFFAGCKVRATESWYAVKNDSFYLNGIVDCILEDCRKESAQNGTAVIVDFKTKYELKLADYTGDDGLVNFQLPLYLRLAEAELGKEVHTALFFSIVDASPQVLFGKIDNIVSGKSVPHKAENSILYKNGEYTRIMNEFDEKTKQFTEEVTGGAFALRPRNLQICQSCEYNKVCRTMYAVNRGIFAINKGKNHGS